MRLRHEIFPIVFSSYTRIHEPFAYNLSRLNLKLLVIVFGASWLELGRFTYILNRFVNGASPHCVSLDPVFIATFVGARVTTEALGRNVFVVINCRHLQILIL